MTTPTSKKDDEMPEKWTRVSFDEMTKKEQAMALAYVSALRRADARNARGLRRLRYRLEAAWFRFASLHAPWE